MSQTFVLLFAAACSSAEADASKWAPPPWIIPQVIDTSRDLAKEPGLKLAGRAEALALPLSMPERIALHLARTIWFDMVTYLDYDRFYDRAGIRLPDGSHIV